MLLYTVRGITRHSLGFSVTFAVCNNPTAPANGDVTLSDDAMMATYTCEKGYALNGVTQRNCGNDETGWSDEKPACGKSNILFERIF